MDLSTIGVKFGWAVEETAGTKPTLLRGSNVVTKSQDLISQRKRSIQLVLRTM